MNHRERFFATIERRPVDRPASWLGLPHQDSYQGLFKYFNVDNMEELRHVLDDDIFPVELPYHSPISDAIYAALNFAKDELAERNLNAPGFFEDYSDPAGVKDFDWPDPSKYIDPEECKEVVNKVPEDYPILGVLWSCQFQDTCSAFGMETAFIKMLSEPEMFRVVINRITEFYLQANEIFYKATKGKLDAILIGDDFGAQPGLLVSPDSLRKYVFPNAKKLIDQAKSYGLKVIYHSCGSIHEVIPDLIKIGVDAIHPIQALAKNMQAEILKRDFEGQVSFCGGMDAQKLLPFGTTEQIKNRVKELRELFPTGLIISPSHEAVLPDVDPANIEALFQAVKGL
jgi:uroporphyrinogen decarboxylase